MPQSIAQGYANLFKSEPNRDEKGRFATKMYRGHGKGSSTTGTLTWVTPDKATAKGYADHRDDGLVSELDVELKNTFDLGRDTRKLTPSKFAVEVLAEAKAQGLVDDKTALTLRSEFMKDQGKEEVTIHSLWAEEDGKNRVAKLLSGAGFDSVKLSEQGADTYGLLKKRDVVGFSHIFKANPYHDELGRFSSEDRAKFVSVGAAFSTTLVNARIDEAARKMSIGGLRDDARMSKLGFTVLSDSEQANYPELSFSHFSTAKTTELGQIDLPRTVIQGDVGRSKVKSLVASHKPVPPIKVAQVGGELVVVDGHHRLAAAKARGDSKIQAELVPPVEEPTGLVPTTSSPIKKSELQSIAHGFAHVFKANPYQDSLGRFTSKDKNVSGASDTEKKLKAKHGVSIASAGSLKDSMAGGAAYGKALKKGEVANSKAWQGTVKDLNDTMDDLADRLGLDLKSRGIVLLARDSDDTGAAGLAQVGGNTMSFSSALQSRKRVAQDRENNEAFSAANGGRNWGYAEGLISNKPKAVTEKDRAEYAQAVMRHEIGHLLTQPKHVKQFKKALSDIGANRAWAKDNISVYGASKTIEAMAEAFAMFTDKRYTPGKLPKQVEDVMANMVSDSKPVEKAEPQGYTTAEFAQDSVGDDDPWDDEIPEVEESPKKNKS